MVCDKKKIEHNFDCFCKRVLKNEVRNYYRKIGRLKEVPIDSLSKSELNKMSVTPDFEIYREVFEVDGIEIVINDYDLIQSLKQLPTKKRDVILLYYFLELTDEEIATKLELLRQTVQYRRQTSLKLMKRIIEELNEE